MDFFTDIILGFSVALQPGNLIFCFLGVLIGTLVGVLPGIGANAALALLLPMTFRVPPVSAIIMMAGIYYGSMYGGSTTSILLNLPGEASSVMTCADGYVMAQKGRAGVALGISAIGSFIGGTISIIGLMFFAPPLAGVALKFGAPEYFSLMLLGLILLIYLASSSVPKALVMALFGIILATVGIDNVSGRTRFAFGIPRLMEGINLIPIIMGLFGISEIFYNLEKNISDAAKMKISRFRELFPDLQDWKVALGAILRGSFIGFFLGILPGGGAIISSFSAYAIEKKISKNPDKFGTGCIEGVAAPESANNAASGSAFIPALALGIPTNVVMAVILGALMINGIKPGPMLISTSPDLFWGVVTSMYVGNTILLILNLPLIGIWVQLLRVPYKYLFPLITIFCLIGAYSLNNSVFDMLIMAIFGVLGYVLKKIGYESAPLILAFLLSPMVEESLRQALLISDGSFSIFVYKPISAVCLGISFALLLSTLIPVIRKKRKEATA
jgi:putative tricarboxylic transport membrane protein